MALALLVAFQKQKLQRSHPSGCSVSFVIRLRGACNQGKKHLRNFNTAQSLVDTRSVAFDAVYIKIMY